MPRPAEPWSYAPVVTAPRLFGIPAAEAPVVAVVRRGPSDWWHLGRWHVGDRPSFEPGAWVRGTIYPQRCDLSPDGRWFCYFTLRGRADWSAGTTYVAVSRLPWAAALAAWGTDGTWTRGLHFVAPRDHQVGPPDEGDDAPLRLRHGLAPARPASFAVERRGGWTESPDSPPADAHEPVGRAACAPRDDAQDPAGERADAAGQRRVRGVPHVRRREVRRAALPFGRRRAGGGAVGRLRPVDGRLLVATADGRLQVRDGRDGRTVRWETDVRGLAPDPRPAPPEAASW